MYKERIKLLREQNRLTQEEISKILGISRGSYGHYEIEDDIISIKLLNALANYYNVSLDYIFGFTKNLNYRNSKNIDKKISGLRLKEFRHENKLTQVKLAKDLNIANGTVAEYERGTNIIATINLYYICSKYHISADYLLGKIDSPKNI